MKGLARLNLIDKIATELQSLLTTTEINAFLGGYEIEHEGVRFVKSKRIYVTDLLANTPLPVIIEIASDLEIGVPIELQRYQESQETGAIDTTSSCTWRRRPSKPCRIGCAPEWKARQTCTLAADVSGGWRCTV